MEIVLHSFRSGSICQGRSRASLTPSFPKHDKLHLQKPKIVYHHILQSLGMSSQSISIPSLLLPVILSAIISITQTSVKWSAPKTVALLPTLIQQNTVMAGNKPSARTPIMTCGSCEKVGCSQRTNHPRCGCDTKQHGRYRIGS